MRWTRLGLSVLAAAGLTAFGGLVGGNNLLYLVASVLISALAAAWVQGRFLFDGMEIELSVPDQVFADTPFRLAFEARNPRRRPLRRAALTGPWGRAEIPYVPGRDSFRGELTHRFRRRGRTRAGDLVLETVHPLGLFRRRKALSDGVFLVLPSLFDVRGLPEPPTVRREETPVARRGRGDDFHGLRDYAPDDDAGRINWKLSAKTGRPVVVEYAETSGRRVTLYANGTPGPGTEARISEAASLARHHIDAGAEVRLSTNEGEIPFGRGLFHLQMILEKLALLGDGAREAVAPVSGTALWLAPAAAAGAPSKALYLAAAAAVGSLALVDRIPPAFTAAAFAILPVGWLFDRRRRHPIPRWVFDAGALAVLALAFLAGLPSVGLIPTVAGILLYVAAVFLWSEKTGPVRTRLLLALFLLFVLSSSQAVDLVYFPVFAIFFLAAAAWLDGWNDPLLSAPAPLRPMSARSSHLGGVLAFGTRVLVLAALLFVVLPRAYSPRMQQLLAATGLNRFQDPRTSFAGLSDRVDLGFFGRLRKNPARAMQVRFPQAPPGFVRPEVLRVRAGAFDRFAGRRWVRTPGDFAVRDGGRLIKSRNGLYGVRGRDGLIAFPGFDPGRPAVVQELLVYPMIGSTVFSAGGIAALETGSRSAAFDLDDTVTFPFLFGAPIRYRVRAAPGGPDYGDAIEGYADILQTRFLDLTGTDDRWRIEAERMTARARGGAEKAAALEAWLRTRFAYSLAASDNRQDLTAFLLDSRAGNCEYFASAMTLLLRRLGIPSRLVVGFLASEWNEFGSFFDVRQSDAHAWVEAYLPGRGWTTFDPTPADVLDRGASLLGVVWGRIRRGLDAVESRWYRYVVGFDPETRASFFHWLGQGFVGLLAPIAGITLLAALAAVLKGVIPRLRRRRSGRGPAAWRHHFYYRVMDGLRKAGLERPPGRTPADWAAEVVRRRPDCAELSGLTETFYAVRYAGEALTPEAERLAFEAGSRILLALRRSSPPPQP